MLNTLILTALAASPVIQQTHEIVRRAEITPEQFEAIVNKINSNYNQKFSDADVAAINHYKTSALYKANSQTLSIQQVKTHILEVIESETFTDDEKVAIGRAIIQNYAYENFFHNIGLDTTKIVSDSATPQANNVIDPITGTDLIVYEVGGGTHNIKVVGNDGLSSSWAKLRPGEEVFNFSNQEIYKTYISLIGRTEAFNAIKAHLVSSLTSLSTQDLSFTDALRNFKNDLIGYINSLNINDNDKALLLNTGFIAAVNDSGSYLGANDDETYEKLMDSKLGIILEGPNASVNKTAYQAQVGTPTATYVLPALRTAVLAQIQGVMTKWSNLKNDQIDRIKSINSGKLLDEDLEVTNLIKIYSQIFGKSAMLTRPVQMRINGDFVPSHSILVRGGITNDEDWALLDNYKLNTIEFSESTFRHNVDLQELYAKYVGTGNTISSQTFSTNFANTQKVSSGADVSGFNALVADNKGVMRTGSESSFYMSFHGSIQNNIDWNGGTWLHENDHDNDGSIKNDHAHSPFIATPVSAIIFDQTDTDISKYIGELKLQFGWNQNNRNDQETTFSDLRKQLPQLYKQVYSQVVNAISNPNAHNADFWHGTYDSTSVYKFKIQLNSIDFGDIRFHTYDDSGYDDTHSDWFNFTNAKVNWSVILTKMPK